METIKVKYHNDNIDKITKISVGDWIDLRAAETVTIPANTSAMISLGVSMKLPQGYEAHVAPRSSTFKNYGIIQTNSVGVIDNSYSGTNDIWKMPVYATRNTVVHENDRICQFRIMKTMGEVECIEVDSLDDTDRGGFGSTGVQ